MPKRKSLLKTTAVEVAKAKRTCMHSGNAILKGNVCVVVFDGPRDRHGYCQDVGLKMIADARLELERLELTLTGNNSG